ncbi:hypothetical protein BCF33_0310 [Hasllibacter halocynthiae]|uniref:Flp pilus assembly protein TadG n=1 Tax=Hasllibacter halocynthiae TaxID=595589 RepID=A0A2T0X767_9RHOB|nr:hypothetical protein [Hasllibacter halocynthiae]PRY94714.1 hypothetical protein BCF33_0310 [Hasllibacter halocynthiae]
MTRRIPHRMAAAFRRFFRDEDGVLSIEAALTWPLLFMGCALMMVLWDGFSTRTKTLRANYVVADLASRQTERITQGMLDDYNTLFRLVSASRGETAIRVSLVTAELSDPDDPDSELLHSLRWSEQSGGVSGAPSYEAIASDGGVPPMVAGEHLLIVDVFRSWVPIRSFGELAPQLMTERSATRPRFSTTIDFR